MVGTATTPAVVVAPADPLVEAVVVGVVAPLAPLAPANPLNWVSVTPVVDVRALNWLSNDDSSASMSVGLWTLGIWVVIF